MLSFLKKDRDEDPDSEVVVFYTDFSKALDKVPHCNILKKVVDIAVGSCLLKILFNKLKGTKSLYASRTQDHEH